MSVSSIQQLCSVKASLGSRDQDFAESLIRAFNRYGSLTAGQQPYVSQLIERAQGAKATPTASVAVGDFAEVVALFARAAASIKFPKVRLLCQGTPIILSVAGAQSKAPGTINVCGEGSFPNRAWYGRVTPSGQWEPARSVSPAMLAALTALLADFGRNPAEVAAAYGMITGSCCFCARELTDARSVSAGYGPVCAERYGLTGQWEAAADHAESQAALWSVDA